ncbi:hypothetical protein KOR34_37660 [Posidoniimonas corsicana]|uniref:Uncharacterized protein n=1 Tax=Posidoniimonas corsicana TaxID=1938618 RepID=A0A5C5V772_9BACT|nr:hypothetical protein [Posidoniimonas corsicana]TWT33930.1 hypothetical protein KOR34_37660 [Posidoniimonas corsicana]
MAANDQFIREYFQAGRESFWRWEDDGKVIAWGDGKTITFLEEATVTLNHLAPHGLPRFGSLLLLLAATRKNWATDGSEAGLLAGVVDAAFQKSDQRNASATTLLSDALAGLHKVRALDSSLRSSPEAKAALAEIVFAGPPAVAKPESQAVASAVRPGLTALLDAALQDTASLEELGLSLMADLAELSKGLGQVSPESVRLRMETGLNALPAPAPIEAPVEEVPPCEAARRVIAELLEHPEYAGVSRVASRLLSSASLPRRLTDAHHQETGGFSDITNRGDPDRLLLSELAQDGLTLAVRVAMNEAMYLHRETPPSTPRVRRELLIDSGVRAWGTPRVLAAAAALAFAASTPKSASLKAWRGEGTELREVDLSTTSGLVAHLGALGTAPNLSESIPAFGDKVDKAQESTEAILIMPAESWGDEQMKASLRALSADRVYVATVSRGGEFRLIERRLRGQRTVRLVRVDPNTLLEDSPPLHRPRDADHLPAIFREGAFPLRMPHQLQSARSWFLAGWGALAVTKDGRLMRWTERGRGAVQLSDQVPRGALWWASPNCLQGMTSFVCGTKHDLHLVHADLVRRSVRCLRIHPADAAGVVMHNGALMVIREGEVHAIGLTSGESTGSTTLPRYLDSAHGRYFRIPGSAGHMALSHTGDAPSLDKVTVHETLEGAPTHRVDLWDVVGVDGPVALNSSGVVFRVLDGEILVRCTRHAPAHIQRQSSRAEWKLRWTSPDGECVGVWSTSNGVTRRYRVDLETKRVEEDNPDGTDGRVDRIAQVHTCRNRFVSIGVDRRGRLTLLDTKSRGFIVSVRNNSPLFVTERLEDDFGDAAAFTQLDGAPFRFRLSEARWPDGSRAVLDSRGLLHLMPGDASLPEVSLVLAEGELTGWCNAQAGSTAAGVFGKNYFLPADDDPMVPRASSRQVMREAITPFAEGIRAAT